MTNLKSQTAKVTKALLCAVLAASASAAFAGSTWTSTNFSSACTGADGSVLAGLNASATCGGSPNPALSGYSTGTGTTTSPGSGTTFASARIYDWTTNGLGVVATNESATSTGPHSTDNVYGIDAMLLNFSASGPVTLSSLTIGWNGTDNATGSYIDSDLSVLAWTGTGAPNLLGATIGADPSDVAGLLKTGWTLVGNYADVGKTSGNAQAISSTIYSSYWLVSAYSTAYGSTNSGANGTSLDAGNDAFKLLALAGSGCNGGNVISGNACVPPTTNKTPEPGSLALMGAAMVGFMTTRRRKTKAV